MAEKTAAIPLSELPVIDDNETGDFWLFASTEDNNGVFESKRYNLSEYLKTVKGALQLERRISLSIGSDIQTMFIGEGMTIYKTEALNISTLKINGQDVTTGADVNIEVPPRSLVTFETTRTTTDPTGYIFIYARAKVN